MINDDKEHVELISKMLDKVMDSYIGKYEMTPNILAMIEKHVRNLYGEAAKDWKIEVVPDAIMKDRVIVTVHEPYPLNNVEITFNV